MGKRKEVVIEEKVTLIKEYLARRIRMREAARGAGPRIAADLHQPSGTGFVLK